MNSLKGFSNKSIKVIAICNNSYIQYCYSKCIEPKGYSVIEMKDLNCINVYSGSMSIDAPLNIYEKNSLYQVIYYEDIPKNSYCSKSWNGFINVQNLSSNKLTLSIVNKSNKTKNVKAYLGNIYVPFSRTKYFSDILQFNKNFGISLPEYESHLLESNEQLENRYGSVDINTDYFNESNLIIGGENLNLEKSYITSFEIIHSEFDDSGESDSSKETDGSDETDKDHSKKQKKQIIIACSVVIPIIFIAIVILITFIVLKKNQKNYSSNLENSGTSTLENKEAPTLENRGTSTLENRGTSTLENSETSTF